jgi:large subunit ribosomal protein L28
MAQRCAVCGKEPRTGYTVSHSHHKTKRRFVPNLQSVRAVINGVRRRARVCTACLKAGKVARVA